MAKKDFSRAGGLLYEVPPSYAGHIAAATAHSFIPGVVASNILGSEGGFQKNALSKTGASGPAQFTGPTFLETAWRFRDMLAAPYKSLLQFVERHNTSEKGEDPVYKFRVKPGHDAEKIMALRNDPAVAIPLGVRHMEEVAINGWKRFQHELDEKIEALKNKHDAKSAERLACIREEKGRAMNAADLKIFYTCGEKGGAKILAAAADPATQNHRVSDYTTKGNALSNRDLFTDNNANLSVPKFIEHVKGLVGNVEFSLHGKSADPLPEPHKTKTSASFHQAAKDEAPLPGTSHDKLEKFLKNRDEIQLPPGPREKVGDMEMIKTGKNAVFILPKTPEQ